MPSGKTEIEIKFRVADAGALADKLRELGFKQITPATHEHNTLYDTARSQLRRRGELLRLRKYGDVWTLTHKTKGLAERRHKTRVEHETKVADGRQMESILPALGFRPAFVYEKYRAEWSDGRGEVVVDRTPIGVLAEIEGAPRWIDETARRLGVKPAEYITLSYAELFQQWKRKTRSRARNMTFKDCRSKIAD